MPKVPIPLVMHREPLAPHNSVDRQSQVEVLHGRRQHLILKIAAVGRRHSSTDSPPPPIFRGVAHDEGYV